jgi:3-oxoacyl-[acyl-carrier-protein] synthase-3
MKKVFLNAISYHLPDNILTNELISEEFPEWDVNKISSKTGVIERHHCGSDEFASDMACIAADKLFSEYKIDKGSIDFLLYCTQSPDYFLPTTACILQNRLGLRTNIGALDFNLGCSGFVYGLSLAKSLIMGNMAKNVLLITSETYSKFIHPKDKSNKTIFGDAAAATLISDKAGKIEIGEFIFGTDGRGAENLIVKNGGIRNYKKVDSDFTDEFGNLRNDNNLYMNGSEIFNFTSESIPLLTKEILGKINLELSEIDLFIFHQANKFMLDHIRKKIGIPENKFFVAMEHCGNTVSSTIPIAIYDAVNQGKFDQISNCIIEGFGVGYSWAACNLIVNKNYSISLK